MEIFCFLNQQNYTLPTELSVQYKNKLNNLTVILEGTLWDDQKKMTLKNHLNNFFFWESCLDRTPRAWPRLLALTGWDTFSVLLAPEIAGHKGSSSSSIYLTTFLSKTC